MAYELNKSNGEIFLELAEGIVNNTAASVKFVGKNVTNYGEIQNENFLHLLENFSDDTAPIAPLKGQLWFDSTVGTLKLKVYDGSIWHQLPSVSYGTTATSQVSGDLWFNTITSQLFIKTSSTYTVIGPNAGVSATPASLVAGNYLTGNSFNGATATTWAVDVGTVTAPTGLKVVARDSAGDIWFTVGHGTATSAQYADLAEKYVADEDYEIGTVVSIGGNAEVTAALDGDRAIGVVSNNPAYMMNSELANGTYIALKGRVPVNIIGDVKKGSKLVAASKGKAKQGLDDYFAISLEDSNGKTTVEALVL